MPDDSRRLLSAVADCRDRKDSMAVLGHGSKALLGGERGGEKAASATLLSTCGHTGIVDYRPQELVVTARAGTPLAELAEAVAAEGQLLPFDPPRFGGKGTFGGAVASGLSGPARPWRGGVRDAVLGVEIVNGRGEQLRFGGSVIKNVAGYDVSRLMTGAGGTLGLILSASVRLLPAPTVEETFLLRCDAAEAGERMRRWARMPLPITATCHAHGALQARLSGSAAGVASARARMGLGEAADPDLWRQVRDHEHPFFAERPANQPLTRLALPRGCRFHPDDALIEWGGCQAWLRGEPEQIPEGAQAAMFHGDGTVRRQPPEDAATAKYSARIKQAFDPDGIFQAGLAF